MGKFADANYVTVFDKEMVNVYDANDTTFTVSKGAILCGFRDPELNVYRIPLVNMVRNNNTDTIILMRPPTEFLPNRPTTNEAIHNVYQLKTQPELVRYHHASTGFLAAIKNKHFPSWPGLTLNAARRHFPDSEEIHKGHGRKTHSGLRSTKTKLIPLLDDSNEAFSTDQDTQPPRRPAHKEKMIFHHVLDLEDKATQKNGPIRQASSQRNQGKATNTSWYSQRVTATSS
jgi:hypothetical protein